ncbi:hypothetical protein BCR33DRAFT_722575, partial [Rhizoclosmatium globosum]
MYMCKVHAGDVGLIKTNYANGLAVVQVTECTVRVERQMVDGDWDTSVCEEMIDCRKGREREERNREGRGSPQKGRGE